MCDKRDRSITGNYILSWSSLYLNVFWSFTKGFVKGKVKLDGKCFQTCRTRFVVFFPVPSCCVSSLLLKTKIFFLRFQKQNTRPNVSYSNRFRPSLRKRLINGNTTHHLSSMRNSSSIWCMTSSCSKTSVFVRPHGNEKPAFSKISTPKCVFVKLRFRWPFSPDTCRR